MKLAEEYRKQTGKEKISIAFPCISTGIYAYPKEEACKVAVDTIKGININEEEFYKILNEILSIDINDNIKLESGSVSDLLEDGSKLYIESNGKSVELDSSEGLIYSTAIEVLSVK